MSRSKADFRSVLAHGYYFIRVYGTTELTERQFFIRFSLTLSIEFYNKTLQVEKLTKKFEYQT